MVARQHVFTDENPSLINAMILLFEISLLVNMAEALSSQHTNSFPDLLNQANASVVVSTYQAGKLILLRSRGESLNTHFVNLAKPMGVAYANNRMSVGSGVQVVDYFNMPAVGPKVEPVNTHDGAFLPRRIHYTGDIDIHEMGFDDQNELWIINTKMSCLGRLDLNYSFVPHWRPPFITGYDLTDRCHLNGLAIRDGKPKYVSSLGVSDKAAGWRENKAFGGMVMDIDSNQFIAEGLSMPHSPRWYRGKLWVLESGAGQLITIDPESGAKEVIAEMPGFCRGIDFIERYALIGLSQVRETSVFAGLPLTEREQDRKCGVWIINIETGNTEGYLAFSGGVQEIFSVQVVPGKFPALLDLNDPLLATSYSLPDSAVQNFTAPDPEKLEFDKAVALHSRKKLDEAITAYQQVLEKSPQHTEALHHLGIAYRDQQDFNKAQSALEKCVELQPSHANAQLALGQLFVEKRQFEYALKQFNLAIKADKKFAAAYVNKGQLNLMHRQYKEGWENLEWRWSMPTNAALNCAQPKWTGEDISQKTLLVHTEQGDGNCIQFARFLSLAKARCERLIVVCTEPLRMLFKEMECVDEVRVSGNLSAESFDVYCPIMSLPWALGVTQENIPQEPYISIAKEVIVPTITDASVPKIGLVWSGNANAAINKKRSCPLETLLELTQHDDYQFFSLQPNLSKDEADLLAKHGVGNLESDLVSYSHTGALINQLDAVVSVCTSTAHLSGAMGKPTLCLLSHVADWRWGIDETQSTWYPTTTLIRKAFDEPWEGAIAKARDKLANMVK